MRSIHTANENDEEMRKRRNEKKEKKKREAIKNYNRKLIDIRLVMLVHAAVKIPSTNEILFCAEKNQQRNTYVHSNV